MAERIYMIHKEEAQSMPGFKTLKDRVIVLLGANVAGHRLKLFMIWNRGIPEEGIVIIGDNSSMHVIAPDDLPVGQDVDMEDSDSDAPDPSADLGAPILPQGLKPEQELQLWNEIDAACSSFLSIGSQPQVIPVGGVWFRPYLSICAAPHHTQLAGNHKEPCPTSVFRCFEKPDLEVCSQQPGRVVTNALEELCLMIMGTLPKSQKTNEKDNTKRFLFHYSKTRKLGNSNVSSVVHPLLQLVPQLYERRMKRFKVDEEFQGPIARQSRRYFLFRPRNGRRDCEGFKVKNASILGLDLFTQVVRSSDCDAIIIIIDFVDIDLYHYVVHVVYDPNEDTEWNEILRDFGILPPKEEPKDEIEEMVLHLQKEAMVKPYEKMTLAQLKEAEDEFDDEDMRAIETYREKRLQEWKALKKKQKFGELREISGNQYVNEVTNADKDVWVIIHLYRSSIPTCLLVNQHLSLLARKFPETKFVKAIVNSCIQHYHDNCLPTIFVYKNGQIEGKFIGIIECGGINLKLEELEWKLAEVGAIQTDLEENPKKGIVDVMVSSIRNTSIYDDTNNSSSDNDDTK
ncbi:uncharacterized protein LOC107509634 [Rousettus aegyptiacus]|uniref:uncharacterized protein LOC107509634 n=1 Tax=Rousettus aegyptiacus TaxID=9407 RepID=UPI00168D1F58|nr:uncharacterized protein LOC107509634 [Rousettus aegyptiacus]